VAHEIGHLWLDDVVGLTRPTAEFYVDELRAEAWADYFAYNFFRKYRALTDINDFYSILRESGIIQSQLYHREPTEISKGMEEKIDELKNLNQAILNGLAAQNPVLIQITEAIEITLDAVGDIFTFNCQ
jgi:Zn-dependent peptidase ImmA (M78 family)